MTVLDRMEALRKEQGITKVFLAGVLGRKSQIFQDWKEGKSKPSEEQIRLLSGALGTTPEYLTGKTDEKNPATNSDGDLVNGDAELTELLERVRDDPHIRMLFSVTKDATPEDIEKAIKIIQALKGE